MHEIQYLARLQLEEIDLFGIGILNCIQLLTFDIDFIIINNKIISGHLYV